MSPPEPTPPWTQHSSSLPFWPLPNAALPSIFFNLTDLFQPRPQPSLTMEQGLCRQDKLSTRSPQSRAMILYPEQEGLVPTSRSNARQQTATHGLPDPIRLQNLGSHPKHISRGPHPERLDCHDFFPHSHSFSISLHSLGLALWMRPGFKSGLCFLPQDLWHFP